MLSLPFSVSTETCFGFLAQPPGATLASFFLKKTHFLFRFLASFFSCTMPPAMMVVFNFPGVLPPSGTPGAFLFPLLIASGLLLPTSVVAPCQRGEDPGKGKGRTDPNHRMQTPPHLPFHGLPQEPGPLSCPHKSLPPCLPTLPAHVTKVLSADPHELLLPQASLPAAMPSALASAELGLIALLAGHPLPQKVTSPPHPWRWLHPSLTQPRIHPKAGVCGVAIMHQGGRMAGTVAIAILAKIPSLLR